MNFDKTLDTDGWQEALAWDCFFGVVLSRFMSLFVKWEHGLNSITWIWRDLFHLILRARRGHAYLVCYCILMHSSEGHCYSKLKTYLKLNNSSLDGGVVLTLCV